MKKMHYNAYHKLAVAVAEVWGSAITGRFKSAMSRQIDEDIRIQSMKQDCLLNSKNEFFGPAIKKKILEGKTKKIPENHQF